MPCGLFVERDVNYEFEPKLRIRSISRVPYWLSYSKQEEVKQHIIEFLEKEFVHPSRPLITISILLIKNNDGAIRIYIYYRALNKDTIKDKYLMPQIDNLLDQLKSVTRFSKIDLRNNAAA